MQGLGPSADRQRERGCRASARLDRESGRDISAAPLQWMRRYEELILPDVVSQTTKRQGRRASIRGRTMGKWTTQSPPSAGSWHGTLRDWQRFMPVFFRPEPNRAWLNTTGSSPYRRRVDADLHPSRRRPGRPQAPCWHLAFNGSRHNPLQELCSWRDEVIALGGSSAEEPRQESFGAESWLKDPEGQRFLLLVTHQKNHPRKRSESSRRLKQPMCSLPALDLAHHRQKAVVGRGNPGPI